MLTKCSQGMIGLSCHHNLARSTVADLDDVDARAQAARGHAAAHDVEDLHLLAVSAENHDVAVAGVDPDVVSLCHAAYALGAEEVDVEGQRVAVVVDVGAFPDWPKLAKNTEPCTVSLSLPGLKSQYWCTRAPPSKKALAKEPL